MASTDMQFEAPIPGQSLTEAPGNRPYERPPEIVDPEEAIQMHLTRLTDPERLEGVIDAIELGMDIRSLTTGILRSAVAEGIHTVDISLLVAPVLHEFIKATAEDAGLEYDEGFVDEEAEERRRRTIQYAKAKRKLKKKGYITEEEGTEEAIPTGGEELPEPTGEPEPSPEPTGIMKRRAK